LLLLRYSIEVALEHDKPTAALRAYYNLADCLSMNERYDEAVVTTHDGLALARKVGNRYWEWSFLGFSYPMFVLGQWDAVLENRSALPDRDWTEARLSFACVLNSAVPICVHRGRLEEASRMIELAADLKESADVQERGYYASATAALLLASGEASAALATAEAAWAGRELQGIQHEFVKEAFPTAVEAALRTGAVDRAKKLLDDLEALPPGRRPQILAAQAGRFRARLAVQEGEGSEAERLFRRAVGLLRELAMPFPLAVVQLEYAEWLASQGRVDDVTPLLVEAGNTFERLEAQPWISRASQAATLQAAGGGAF
jgi:tetratricopeptide (TPR) repeat protein